jgi:flagellar biosynthesis/type III secretory pathway protein FliH
MAAEFSFAEFAPAPVARVSAPSAHSVLEAAARAEAETEAARAAARDEGYAEGLAAGRAEALAALAPAAAALEQALAGSRDEAVANSGRLEAQAVDLALFIAEKVVGGALAVEPARVLEAVRGALRSLVERERVTVLVHPEDLELVSEAIGEIRASLGGIDHCDVQAERRVGRGGAVVRTPDGDIDARVETKLARAREVVETALGAA